MNDHKLVPIEIQTEDIDKKDAEDPKDSKTDGEIDIRRVPKYFKMFNVCEE